LPEGGCPAGGMRGGQLHKIVLFACFAVVRGALFWYTDEYGTKGDVCPMGQTALLSTDGGAAAAT